MKQFLVIAFLVSVVAFVHSQEIQQTDQYRQLFFYGWEGECGANVLVDKFENEKKNMSTVQKAYFGAALTTLANCKVMPYAKLSVFNRGKHLIEDAIKADYKNGEIRFLRFSVQSHIPQLLNYDDRDEDRPIILETLILQAESDQATIYTWEMIDFMVTYGNLTDDDLKKLNLLVAKR